MGGSDPAATGHTKSIPSHPKTPPGMLSVPQALRISTYEQTAKATICGIKTYVNHLGEEHTFTHALMHACTLQVQMPAESPGITQQASESG